MLNVLILAAGDSTRFRDGDRVPKQFKEFPIDGKMGYMWEHAVRSLNAHDYELYLAYHKKHIGFLDPYADTEVIEIGLHHTRGQLDTMYRALLSMPEEGEIVVLNCDAGYATNVLNALVIIGRQREVPTALTFHAGPEEEDRWSFVSGHPTFAYAKEKKYISPYALTGAYYFPDRVKLKQAAAVALQISEDSKIEPYMSQLFEFLVGGKHNMEINRDHFFDWGTSEAFNEYSRR